MGMFTWSHRIIIPWGKVGLDGGLSRGPGCQVKERYLLYSIFIL